MYRSNYSNHKPEYALKRVNDLIASAIGNNADKEKRFALEQLHNIVSGAKRKQWQKVYEPIMKKHLDLCVELKDHRTAKDGLHQYRNMCQNVDPSSLENVIYHLMDLAESRATQARDKANKVALAAAAKISDLDQEETPESIMLSTMTEEGAKDRTDREVVVPWLKFLWEIYRAILELLHKNAKLEKLYHDTCKKAFKFCLDYKRALEFRRLCEMLRQHLSNLQKIVVQPKLPATRAGWEWTDLSVDHHLLTRFAQLEVATALELWNEGFRTVEDIFAINQLNKKPAKKQLMSQYYEKLTRIFWVSENYLFHAYCWYRFHSLNCEWRKDVKPEEKTLQASSTLLAALCVPTLKEVANVMEEDEVALEKNQQMAMLLDFQANPTRAALLAEMVGKGLLSDVLPELAQLYDLLETKFSPLTLVKELVPILAVIRNHPQLSAYVIPLQRVAVLRLVQHLSKVFTAVKLDFLRGLLVGLDLDYCEVERLIIDGVARRQITLRLDHSSGCARFGAAVSMGPTLEAKLSQVATQLNNVVSVLEKTLQTSKQEDVVSKRREYLELVSVEVEDIATNALERKMIIERRKEGLERLQQERQKEEGKRKEVEEARRREDEAQRLQKEEAQRREAKMKKIRDLMDLEKTKKAMAALGKTVDDTTLEELDESSRRLLLQEAQSEATRAKEEEQKKLGDQARRLDHITRALRIESSELYDKKYQELKDKEQAEYEAALQAKLSGDREEHAKALVEKSRLARMQAYRGEFEVDLLAQQREAYEKRVKAMRDDVVKEYKQRKIAKARRRKIEHDERLEELEQERQEKLAAERQLAEEMERLRRAKQLEEEAEAIKAAVREKERVEREAAEAARAEAAAAQKAKEDEQADVESGWRKQETKSKPRRSFDDREQRSEDPKSGGPPRRGDFGDRERDRRGEVGASASVADGPSGSGEWRSARSEARPPMGRDEREVGREDGNAGPSAAPASAPAATPWRRSGAFAAPPPPPSSGGNFRSDRDRDRDAAEPNNWRGGSGSGGGAAPSAPAAGGGGGGGDKWSRLEKGFDRDSGARDRDRDSGARDRDRDSGARDRDGGGSSWRGGGGGGGEERRRDDRPRPSGPPDESSWRRK